MSEPDISTLARRLAEQNNVDWRSLNGSGPEGKVVERDVLDFLARVMAGSEALDPTPEPLPEGMEAWPEQDLAGFRQGVAGSASGLAALRDEIGATAMAGAGDDIAEDGAVETVAFGRSAYEAEAARSGAALAEEDAREDDLLGEDIFLFDDDSAAPAAEPEPLTQAVDPVDELDDLLVAGDDDDQDRVTGAPGYGADELRPTDLSAASSEEFGGDFASDFAGDAAHPGAHASTAGEDAFDGFGNLGDSDFDAAEAADDLPDLFSEPAAAAEAVAHADAAIFTGDDLDEETDALDAFVAEPVVAEFVGEDFVAEGFGGEAADEIAEPTERSDEFESFTADPVASLEEEVEDVAAEPFAVDDEPFIAPPAAGSDLVDHAAAASAEEESFGSVEAREVAAPLTVSADALPLARPGNLLRRNIDLSSLAGAQLAVGLELGHAEPLSVAAFLIRAVAKAAFETGLTSGPVALADFGSELRLRRVDDAASRSFAALVSLLDEEFTVEDEPALVVADLGPFDLDEVILDLDVPVVSLGRVLYDTHRGGYRSTLAVAGDVPPERGARFLARVAELLDAPVRLVL